MHAATHDQVAWHGNISCVYTQCMPVHAEVVRAFSSLSWLVLWLTTSTLDLGNGAGQVIQKAMTLAATY